MPYLGVAPNPRENREVDDISSSFNGSTTAFTLQSGGSNVSPGKDTAIIVSLGGVVQNPGTDYTIAASTITFTTAPASGLSFFGVVLAQSIDIETTADNTVTTAKIVNDAVTAAKLASNSVVSDSIVDGSIVNADVNASAAIARTKLANVDVVDDTSPQLGGNLDVNTKNIVFGDSSDGSSDDVLSFGASGDLKIFHQADQSRIVESGPSVLKIMGSDVRLSNAGNTADYMQCNDGAEVSLFHNNTKMIETTSTGTSIPDGKFAKFGASDDMSMGHNTYNYITYTGADLLITGDATNQIKLMPKSDEAAIVCKPNGSVDLYYDGSKKFETASDGVLIGDGALFKFGADSDAYISHTGSDFIILNGTGTLAIGNNSGTGVGEGSIVFKSGNNNSRWTIESGGNFIPAANNAFAIGSSSNRVSIIYSNAALNTSDKTLKNTITTSDLGLDFINKLKPVSYKWNQYEGEISDTRTHYGLIAQDVEEVITSSGKTLNDFGGVDKPEEGCMGLAYSQFVSPLIKAVQELSAKVAALEAA